MPRNLRRGLQQIIRPARFCMKPRNLEPDILASNYLSPKALRFTTSRLAISTSPRLYPSSTLFSQHHSELILSEFGSQFSMSAAHKKPGMGSTSFVILYTAFFWSSFHFKSGFIPQSSVGISHLWRHLLHTFFIPLCRITGFLLGFTGLDDLFFIGMSEIIDKIKIPEGLYCLRNRL